MTKYRNKPTEVDGIRFASKAEARRYTELKLLERAGEIKDLTLQPRYPLSIYGNLIATYVADFQYIAADGKPVIEDVKGVQTPAFKIKAKLFEALHGHPITLVK